MENKITSKEAPTPAAPVASENEIPPVVIEAEPKPRLFSFDSLEKVKGVIAKIQGVAEKIQKTLERLDEKGKLKSKPEAEAAKTEISASVAQYLQGHPEATDPKADGAAKKSALAFLNTETKFPLLPQDQQLAFLKGEPLRWKDADAKAAVPPGSGGWKESRLRFSLALKLEARALEESGKTNEAAQFYHSASLFAPQDIGLHADAARLLKAQSAQTQDPALKKQQEDAAEKHLDAVADEMQVGRIEVLIGKGKLGEADKLAERIKGEFYIQLSAEQRKVLAASPKVQCRLLEVNVYQAEIADKQGKHEQAVDIYKRFLKFGDQLIEKHPGHAEAYLLRAKIHHGLGDYAAAVRDYQALAKAAPEEAGYVAGYRQDLAGLAKRYSAEWHLAEAMGDHGKATLYLAEEVKVREACGDAAGVQELSAKLAALSKEMSFEKLVAKAQELAGGAHLSPLNARLKDLQAFVKFSAKDGGGYKLELTEAFQKSGDAKKLEVLQKLHLEGFIALHQSLAAKETDPAKKNYYQGKALLLEGKLPAARLKLIAFKAQTEGAKDPELQKMRAESGLLLRQLTLAGLEKLSVWAEAFGAQKKGSAVTTLYKHATQGGYEEANKLLVDKLIACLQAGKADTVEEALAVLKEQHRQDVEALRKHPVAGPGEKVSYLYDAPEGAAAQGLQFSDDTQVKKLFALYAKDPRDPQAAALKDPKAFPGSCFFKLEGGTLDLGVSSAGDTKYPPKIRVVIGKEGGVIRAEGGTYKFPPSKEERVVLFSSGRLDSGALKRDLKAEGGAAGDYEAHAWSALEKSDFAKHNGEAKRLAGLIDHAANLKAADPDFHALFSLETREGLEKIQDPEAGRAHMLEVAKQLRHRTGCYAVAAEILEGLFRSDFQAALAEIPADKIEQVKKEVEAERPKVEKQVKADLAKLREKHPEDYAKRFPSGAPSQAEIKGMVDQALAGKLSIKIRKMAFEKVDAKAEQGPLSDPVATQAWKLYDDMKDPTDKTWNLADESWDGIVDEVIVTAVTMPVTMGTGALVRGGLGGTSLALRWAAQGGGRALAVKTGVFLAGAAVEGFTMAALGPGDFELKNAGFNILMSIAFHGGGKAWGKAGAKLGLDEAALAALRAEGKAVAGKSAANFAGTMLTQTAVATTMGYAGDLILNHDNPNTFWERFGGEALRMLAFHYGTHAFNMATGHALVESDAANQAKMKAARESYMKWVEQGLPKEEAAKRAVAYAKDVKLNLKSGETSYDLKDADLEVQTKAPEKAKAKPAAVAEGPAAVQPVPEKSSASAAAKAETKPAPVEAKPPAPKGLPAILEAQVQKAKKLAALGVERGLVDKNAAERLPRELEAYLRLFIAEAERTLDAQRPGLGQQKKIIPELAKQNAENFTRRFAEELGLKKEANFQKKLEGLLRESLERVAARHNERLPSFPLESSAAKPAAAKPKRADKAEIAAGLEQFSKALQSQTEQWLAAKEKGGKTVSREAFLQEQCEAAFQLAERLGVAGDPAFRKGLAEMVVGVIRRSESHAPAGAWLPDSMAAYAKKAPVEKPDAAAKSESPKLAPEAAPAKKTGGLDIDQVVVEVSLLAKEYSGDPVAFKKELARVLITGFHELQKWVAKDSPGHLEVGERVQFVSEALAKKLAAHFGVAKDAAFVKKIEGMLRGRLKDSLAGKAPPPDAVKGPLDFSEQKVALQVESLFPEIPGEVAKAKGEGKATMPESAPPLEKLLTDKGISQDPDLKQAAAKSHLNAEQVQAAFDLLDQGLNAGQKKASPEHRFAPEELASVRKQMMKAVLEGKISKEQAGKFMKACEVREISSEHLEKAFGLNTDPANLPILRELMGVDWFGKMLENPQAFLKGFKAVEQSSNHLRRMFRLLEEGRSPEELAKANAKNFSHLGIELAGAKDLAALEKSLLSMLELGKHLSEIPELGISKEKIAGLLVSYYVDLPSLEGQPSNPFNSVSADAAKSRILSELGLSGNCGHLLGSDGRGAILIPFGKSQGGAPFEYSQHSFTKHGFSLQYRRNKNGQVEILHTGAAGSVMIRAKDGSLREAKPVEQIVHDAPKSDKNPDGKMGELVHHWSPIRDGETVIAVGYDGATRSFAFREPGALAKQYGFKESPVGKIGSGANKITGGDPAPSKAETKDNTLTKSKGGMILPPPPSDGMPEVRIPKPAKVPMNLERKMAVANDIFEAVYPSPEGRPRYLEANIIEEVQSISHRLGEIGLDEPAFLLRSDLEIAMKAPYETEAYKGAIARLGHAVAIRRVNPEFNKSPVEFMGEGNLHKLGATVAKIYDGSPLEEVAPGGSKPGSAASEPVPLPKQAVNDLQAMKMLKEKGIAAKDLVKHLVAIRKMKTLEEARIYVEKIPQPPVGSEDMGKAGVSKAPKVPATPDSYEELPLAAHGSPLGKVGHGGPDSLAPQPVKTPPPSISGVKVKGSAPDSISLDWAANDSKFPPSQQKNSSFSSPLSKAPPESTWASPPSEASSIPDSSVAGIANSARKAEIAKAWVAACENPKSPLHGDPEYQASYQAAKAYLSAVESGKAPPEAGFVADYHVTAKDAKGSGVLAFADPSQPPEKTWEVAGQDGQGRWQLKNLKTGETRSFQVLFQDKPAFLEGDRLRFLPMVAGASDGPLRPLRPAAEGQALWIGRDPAQANVVLSADFVSRLHCSIERAPEGWYVADRHSTNGVYVNGVKVEKSAWLKPGDVLSTKDKHGQFHLLGVFQPPAAAVAAAPAPKLPLKPSGNAGLFVESAPILHGDVDLKAPPVHRLKPDAGSGEVAAVTTQGAGYGKKNEDNVLVMRGKGGLLMLDVDGMGGEGHGDVAALLTAEAFKAEMHRSGDEGQAWALANKTVRRFNAELHHLSGGKPKWAKPEQVQQALAAARAGIADPAAPLPEQGGAGAVAVAVRVHPPKQPGEAHRAEFSWVGDARAMILERGADGKWQWVFRTVDEGLPSVPGMLRPGEDYEFGGARKTLAGALHPMANVVTNSVGKEGAVAVKKTSDGEFPAPGTATGAKEAGKGYEAGVALKPGQMILAGSDGFWENFGSTREVLDLIQFCKTAEQAREVLTHEAHRRMEILAEARDWLGNPAANPKRLERYPFEHHGKKQFIDAKGRVFDAPSGGKAVNHFKTDNFSLITYLHNPAAEAASAPAEPLPAAAHAKAGPHPVKLMPMVPGNIPGLRKVDDTWIYAMPKASAEVVIGRDAFPASQETEGVSAKHVRLIRSVGSIFVQDMGSLNGIKVLRDGKEVFAWKSHDRKPGPTFAVHPGDRIVMEGTTVYFFGSE